MCEVLRLGSTAARLKLKGIDGGPHKRWSMWFNLMQCEEFYLPLILLEFVRDDLVFLGIGWQVLHGCRQLVLWDVGLSLATSATLVLSCQYLVGYSRETAGDKPEEGGDDVKSLWPLWVGLHTCYNGRYKGLLICEGELILESWL